MEINKKKSIKIACKIQCTFSKSLNIIPISLDSSILTLVSVISSSALGGFVFSSEETVVLAVMSTNNLGESGCRRDAMNPRSERKDKLKK